MRASLLQWSLITACSACAPRASSQTAEVTLYSHGSWASELHPFSRNGVFFGGIWDNGDPLVLFVDRPFKTNNRFVVFNLPLGTHVLGMGEGRKPRKGSEMTLNLAASGRYFVRAHEASNVLGTDTSHFEVVPCQVAHDDLAQSSALDERSTRKEKRGLLNPVQAAPSCP